MVTCTACHDQLRQTMFYEPAHDSGYDPLTGWVMAADPGPEGVGDDGQRDGDRVRPGGRGDADDADDFVGGVRAEDARVPARCRLAGSGRERGRVGVAACFLGDSYGDVVTPGWFVHMWHCKRGMRHFRAA